MLYPGIGYIRELSTLIAVRSPAGQRFTDDAQTSNDRPCSGDIRGTTAARSRAKRKPGICKPMSAPRDHCETANGVMVKRQTPGPNFFSTLGACRLVRHDKKADLLFLHLVRGHPLGATAFLTSRPDEVVAIFLCTTKLSHPPQVNAQSNRDSRIERGT